jgi:Domain of unknown function (DUF397)
MCQVYNGMSSVELRDVQWRKSQRSSAQGNCVEVARLPGGEVAMRNSRHPDGPALVFTYGEFEAFVLSAKDGDFNNLLQ